MLDPAHVGMNRGRGYSGVSLEPRSDAESKDDVRLESMKHSTIVAIAAIAALAACNQGGPALRRGTAEPSAIDSSLVTIPVGDPGIRGIVTAAEPGILRVEANPAEASGSPKAVVRLPPSTPVLFRNGEPGEVALLTIGHNVSVWFSGPVMESYPVQGAAALVVIEPAPIP